ncbi:AI-2E family transporter [Aestuariivirga sp.]|uniref:AI-2E family transporter n=1 Tax=Aestuariivirga sp. TaxID=2650926 RepID=UPI0035936500
MSDTRDGKREASGFQTAALMEKLVLLMMFVALLVGVLLVVMPFSVGLMFGGIIAIAAWPLRSWLMSWGLNGYVTAFLLLALVIAFIILPILAVAPGLATQLTGLFDVVRAWLDSSPAPPSWLQSIPLIGDTIHDQWILLLGSNTAAKEMLAPYMGSFRTVLLNVAKGLGESLLQLLLAMVFATMFWAQGDTFAATFMDLLHRLGGQRLTEMAVVSVNAVRGVFYGVVGTAAIQAAMMSLGLLLAGVPGAAPLGFVTLLLALSQIGALLINLVWGGAVYWLYANGETGIVLWLLMGWGLFIVFIDNILKPLLIGTSITMPLALVIVGVFGGFLSFGFLGLFIGPVIIAIAYAMITAWRMSEPAKTDT